MILSWDSYESTKTTISLSYLHPDAIVTIKDSELSYLICIICCLDFYEYHTAETLNLYLNFIDLIKNIVLVLFRLAI